MKVLNATIASVAFVAAIAAAPQARAESVYRMVINHAAANCMGSLAADRDMTRARTEGLANVDSGISDVKCGGDSTPVNNASDVEVYETAIRNSTAATVQVDCMLTDGLGEDTTGVTTNYPRSVTIGAGEVYWIDWTTEDTGGTNFSYPSMSCQLPQDVSIVYTAIVYQEDVGL